MKAITLTIAITTIFFYGCSKEELNNPDSFINNNHPTDYMPLSIGNYWVYETYIIDTLGNETFDRLDSAYIISDTLINNKLYHIVSGDFYARLALGEIIRNANNTVYEYFISNAEERIRFTTNNLGTPFFTDSSSLFYFETWTNSPKIINTSFGSLSCYEKQMQITPLAQNYPFGIRNQFSYYNSSVGVISNQFFYFSSPFIFESRLVRYNLN